MRASIVVVVFIGIAACRREASTSGADPSPSIAASSPSVAVTPTPGPMPTTYPTDQPWFDATASTCAAGFATGGHRYALSCRGDACTCIIDGAPGKSFSSSGCGLEQWERCDHPSKPTP